MKKSYLIIKKIVALVICISIISTTVSAAQYSAFEKSSLTQTDNSVNYEDIVLARNIFNNLTPKAKLLFEEELSYDIKLLSFHRRYVAPRSSALALSISSANKSIANKSKSGILKNLSIALAALALPTAVEYSFKAMGAGMVAAVADGPLPVGDIVLAAATASTIVTVAAYWQQVMPKWNKIISAFNKSFSKSSSNIKKAFDKVKDKSKKKFKEKYKKKAKDVLGKLNSNRKNHILNNKKHDHKWGLIFNGKKPSWNELKPILYKVLVEGHEVSRGGNRYSCYLKYKGYKIIVDYIKDANGFIRDVSTAYYGDLR